MIKKIAESSRSMLTEAFKVLVLIGICAILGLGIVFPLWKWASTRPASYTAVMLGVTGALVLLFIVRQFRKHGARKMLFRIAKIVIAAAGIFFSVRAVLMEQRLLGLVFFALAVLLYGIAAFWSRKK